MIQRLVDLEMPIVAAVNGPAAVHSKYALPADVVIAADSRLNQAYEVRSTPVLAA